MDGSNRAILLRDSCKGSNIKYVTEAGVNQSSRSRCFLEFSTEASQPRSKIFEKALRSGRLLHRPSEVLYLPLAVWCMCHLILVFTHFHYIKLKNAPIFNIDQDFVRLSFYKTGKISTRTTHSAGERFGPWAIGHPWISKNENSIATLEYQYTTNI